MEISEARHDDGEDDDDDDARHNPAYLLLAMNVTGGNITLI